MRIRCAVTVDAALPMAIRCLIGFVVLLPVQPGHCQQWVEPPASQQFSDSEIRQASRRVMQDDDFRLLRDESNAQSSKSRGFLLKILDRLTELLDRLFSNSAGNTPASDSQRSFGLSQLVLMLAIVAVVAVVVLILVAVIRSIQGRVAAARTEITPPGSAVTIVPKLPPGEIASNVYEQRALDFASRGNYSLAIRELLLGAMSWIERSGRIRYRRGLTNLDYARAIGRDPPRRQAFSVMSLNFEKVFFGRRQATELMFQECRDCFRKEFREVATNTPGL